MQETRRVTIPAKYISSLCWAGDELVDWVEGGQRYRLDGTVTPSDGGVGYRFDQAVASPNGQYAVIYEKLGTKGLVLKHGKLLREINRSFEHADVYEYPVALFALPDGRNVIAHCPEEYNQIEIDDVVTGERLTARDSKPVDFYHSRLQATSDGRYLLSAGWAWHPADDVLLYDVLACLRAPAMLDSYGIDLRNTELEPHNAAFVGNSQIVLSCSDINPSSGFEKIVLQNIENASTDSSDARKPRSVARLSEPAGRLMPVGNYAVGFYEHPKLIDLYSGEIIMRWPEFSTGKQNSSIGNEETPPLALDAGNKRFAVADDEKIIVIQLG